MEVDFKWFLGVLGIAIGAIAAKLLDRWFAGNDAEKGEVIKLTLAMTELKIEIRHLAEKLTYMPKIQQDLNELHSKVREINARAGV
jgi:hypothetical protein